MSPGPIRASPGVILFDMDGTITRPLLDFDAIRRDLKTQGPILEAIGQFEGERLSEANAILDRHERLAAEKSELSDGCVELMGWLSQHSYRTALITRNSRNSTGIILEKHGLCFDLVLTRDDGPTKPYPQPLLRTIHALGCERHEAWMVGDGSHDIEAATAAGVHSVWISHRSLRTFDAVPGTTIDALEELLPMLAAIRDSPGMASRV